MRRMITVHIIPQAYGLPSVSPYCTKLVGWLELAGVQHTIKSPGDFRSAPYGKLPFIEHDGAMIADTHVIVPYVRAQTGKGLHDDLTAEQRALGHAAMRMAEESIYWILVWERWACAEVWPLFRPNVAAIVPAALAWALVPFIRRQAVKQLHGQGTGRLPEEDIYRFLDADLQALSALLGDKPYLLGDKPTDYDVAVWAPVASGLGSTYPSRFGDTVRKYPNVVAFVDRINAGRAANRVPAA